jgi:hypothetical protein
MSNKTTRKNMKIHPETKELLDSIKRRGESYDLLIDRLVKRAIDAGDMPE